MSLFRSMGARKDATRGTAAIEVRKSLANLFSGPGVLPGAASPLVTGTAGWAYSVGVAGFVSTRGAADGSHLYGNDGSVTIGATGVGSTVPVAPGAGLQRIDIIWVKHPSASENSDTTSDPVFGVSSGAASSSALPPTIPTGALELARNLMTSSATSTASTGNTITQTASQALARGFGVPASFTPVLSPAASPYTAQGRYVQNGQQVTYWFQVAMGAGFGIGAGDMSLSLPVPHSALNLSVAAGTARLYDSSTGNAILGARVSVLSQALYLQASATYAGTLGNVAYNFPWTWANGDIIDGFVVYEAAKA